MADKALAGQGRDHYRVRQEHRQGDCANAGRQWRGGYLFRDFRHSEIADFCGIPNNSRGPDWGGPRFAFRLRRAHFDGVQSGGGIRIGFRQACGGTGDNIVGSIRDTRLSLTSRSSQVAAPNANKKSMS